MKSFRGEEGRVSTSDGTWEDSPSDDEESMSTAVDVSDWEAERSGDGGVDVDGDGERRLAEEAK